MSQAIHQAQAVKSILGDASLPVGERARRAIEACREIDFDKLERQWSVELARVWDALHEAKQLLDQSERLYGEVQSDEPQSPTDSSGSAHGRLLELLDSVASRVLEAELDRIIAELNIAIELPEEAILESREHRDVVVPRLIATINDAIAGARRGELPSGEAQVLAAYLLTEFKVEEAFPVMVEAFSLPGDWPYDLFGETSHELPKRMLAVFRGHQPDAIEALIDDRALNMYFRWEAASSFLYVVREGQISRDEAVRRLQRSLRRAIDVNDGEIAGPLVDELANYAAVEALADIREAFERGLVEVSLIDLPLVEEYVAEGQERFEKELARCDPAPIDTLEEVKTWWAYEEEPLAEPPTDRSWPILPLEAVLPGPHFETGDEPYAERPEPIVVSGPRIGRNDPCPCGSGKKFKKCCGARA